ncbi:hypothetical protein FHR83_008712 [Actinoplanes campanulatus]|uniref:Aminoglycoside phosphotransferase domain-containing protein n=1 Tax=Actinoplanes campanulatus TaxID=113559 RepID=A0A7W5ARI3_9ACTN|nr:phosphotransferase [Actinoplanes campanulatus]MBB3100985.1 hypothetical protein [Actinoplanes campanulatus]GGN49101.1 aminoglycoside phosphotransferase [Actinoplanes campanulatus]GID41803.1 aminoglycoside phosphotransferase [Actinoplanes campanulatus]
MRGFDSAADRARTSLTRHGFQACHLTELPPGAGHRRYLRAATDRGPVVCCVLDPVRGHPAALRFCAVQARLRAAGIRVPRIIAYDQPNGVLLQSDLGGDSLTRILAQDPTPAVMTSALTVMASINAIPVTAARPGGTGPTAAAHPLLEWYLPYAGETGPTAWPPVLESLGRAVARQPRLLQHNDFHSGNLIIEPDGRLGVVDFQDAAAGPALTDLATFTFDPALRRNRADRDTVITSAAAIWRATGLPAGPHATFIENVHIAAVHRLLQLIGVCARLIVRDGRTRYRRELDNALWYLRDLPAAGDLIRAVQQLIPSPPAGPA